MKLNPKKIEDQIKCKNIINDQIKHKKNRGRKANLTFLFFFIIANSVRGCVVSSC